MQSLNEAVQKKWQPVLEHPDLAPIKDAHRRSVVAQLLENQEKSAREEGFDEIADWFETLAKAERSHANKFTKTLEAHLANS